MLLLEFQKINYLYKETIAVERKHIGMILSVSVLILLMFGVAAGAKRKPSLAERKKTTVIGQNTSYN